MNKNNQIGFPLPGVIFKDSTSRVVPLFDIKADIPFRLRDISIVLFAFVAISAAITGLAYSMTHSTLGTYESSIGSLTLASSGILATEGTYTLTLGEKVYSGQYTESLDNRVMLFDPDYYSPRMISHLIAGVEYVALVRQGDPYPWSKAAKVLIDDNGNEWRLT